MSIKAEEQSENLQEAPQESVPQESAPEVQPEAATEAVSPRTEVEAAESEYTPSFKYSAGGKDFEFDPWVQPVITTKEIEDRLRDVYSKAGGLDIIKAKHEGLQKTHTQTTGELGEIRENLQRAGQYMSQNNLDQLFEYIGLPQENVYDWVQKKLDYQQMPVERQAEIDRYQEQDQRMQVIEEHNQSLEQNYQQQAVHARTGELNSVLARPDVNAYAKAYDARLGAGAFANEVVYRADAVHNRTGQDLSAEQAVSEFMNLSGYSSTGQQPVQGQFLAPPASAHNPPVIPNVRSRNASPVRKAHRSLEDLKNYAKTLPDD